MFTIKLTMVMLALFICLLVSQSFGQCEIHTFDKIITTEKFNSSNAQKAIKFTTCSSKILHSFREVLANGQGHFNSYWFNKKYSNQVVIKPSNIHLIPLSTVITQKIISRKNWFFHNAKILGKNDSAFFLQEGEYFHVSPCPNCSKTGKKTIKTYISNPLKKRLTTCGLKEM